MNVCPDADWRAYFVRFRIFLLLMATNIIMEGVSGQCTLVCNSGVQISLPSSGQFTLNPALFTLNAGGLCPGTLELTVWEGPGQIIPDDIVTCDHVGQTLQVQVKHIASGNTCESEVTVNDLLAPSLTCPSRLINCSDDPAPAIIGEPAISDNCTPGYLLDISFYDQNTTLPCGTFQNGTAVREKISRFWQVSDLAGNQSTCVEQIWLRAPALDSVIFPVNHDDFAAPALVCGQNPDDLALTGQPTLFGNPINNSGPCEMGVTFTDQRINGCGPASYTLLRTWLIVDFCTSQIKQRIQVIKIKDTTPPVLEMPEPVLVGTEETACAGTVYLPFITATDSCSAVTVLPVWAYGSGYGPFTGVPAGDHVVTYTATDGCGNSTTATTVVTVADDDPPQVICASALQISLGSNGQALINAASLDAGSWDNCSVVFRSISTNDSTWANTVALNCNDEGIPVPVTLRVTDAVGLSNFCVVMVTARDFLKPLMTCPSNITLTCLQNQMDTGLTGQPVVTDNCSVASLHFTDVNDLSACHTGTVMRTWTAADQSGNTKSCVQTISIGVLPTPSVIFPPNVTLNGCNSALDLTPAATGAPQVTGATCFPLSVTFTDQIFNIAAPACFVVMRTWKVVDQCVYSPNGGGAGFWEYVQQLNVTDQSPPDLIIPADITVSSGAAGCDAWVDLPPAVATDCSPAVAVTHNSIYGVAGADVSGWYPSGTHQVTFTASDGCGNTVQKTLHIVVVDLMPPTAVCLHGLSVNLTPGGLVTINPSLLDGGSTDNCASSALVFTASPSGFSCQHTGAQPVTLFVTDNAGNTGQCQTIINVQDNQLVCPRHSIEGRILTAMGSPVGGIPVSNGFGIWVETDSAGYYRFDSLMVGKDYVITPEYNEGWLNGVTAYDFILISRHILGLEPIDSPERLIAADINNSMTVTTFDIVQMRKVLLGTFDSVPAGKSWRFIPSDFVYINPDNPFSPVYPESIAVYGLDGDLTNKDFTGIKTGDIDNTVDPAAAFSSANLVYRKTMKRILRNLTNEY